MGAPIYIDSIVLTLGRFLQKQDYERNVPAGRNDLKVIDRGAVSPALITLSSGQMLLPGIGVTHRFMR